MQRRVGNARSTDLELQRDRAGPAGDGQIDGSAVVPGRGGHPQRLRSTIYLRAESGTLNRVCSPRTSRLSGRRRPLASVFKPPDRRLGALPNHRSSKLERETLHLTRAGSSNAESAGPVRLRLTVPGVGHSLRFLAHRVQHPLVF